ARFISPESFHLPEKVSLLNQIIIGIFIGSLLWSVAFIARSGPVKVQIKLLFPADEAALPVDVLELKWSAAAGKFQLQVDENGKRMMDRVTPECYYNFAPEERILFKSDRRYTWRVIPLNVKGEQLPHVE